jgi:phosphate/sulfate permease
MSLSDIKQWVEFLWPFISPVAALLCTFTLVSFFKSILKHYRSSKWDKFTVVMVTRLIAFITGYAMAYFFLGHLDGAEEWALGLAILNIPIYSGLIKFATHRQWLWMIALLKGRRLVKRQENGETVEKVMDEDDKTMIMRRTNDQ